MSLNEDRSDGHKGEHELAGVHFEGRKYLERMII